MTSCQHGKRSIRTNTRFCLKAETGVTLYEHESLIIFDEVQLFPQARQAVEAYVEGKNFSEIDMVKRQIISLYEDDFKKLMHPEEYLHYTMSFLPSYQKIQENTGSHQPLERKIIQELRNYCMS